MQSLLERNRFRKKTLALLLCLALLFANVPLTWALPAAIPEGLVTENPVLLVTGDGLVSGSTYTGDNVSREKSYSLGELQALGNETVTERLYSANSNTPARRIYRGIGVDLERLLNLSGYSDKGTIQLISPGDRGMTTSVDLSLPRYHYPNFNNTVVSPIGPMLAWQNTRNQTDLTAIPDTPAPFSNPFLADSSMFQLMLGQTAPDEITTNLFNSGVNKVRAGAEILSSAITILGKTMTRGELLMMPRATWEYTYTTQSGERTDRVRGVPLSFLLEELPDNAEIEFATVDNWSGISAFNLKKSELAAKNAIIVYEIWNNTSNAWEGYIRTQTEPCGLFRLMIEGTSGAHAVNSISIKAAAASSYKHITNGGAGGSAPYNIDALTGATLTVEGPGVINSIPVSVRELEETGDANIQRGLYTDLRGGVATGRMYEGVKVLSILDGLVNSNVSPLDDQVEVVFKNRWRQEVGRLSYANIKNATTPVILAYGTSYADGSNAAPFVFNLAAGMVPGLGNDDGPLKLVYDQGASPGKQFGSVAYMYVEEGLPPPGFKHITATNDAYNNPANTEFILTFTGDELGREVNYTVRELEEMANDNPALCHREEYSLSNTTYWYVNDYEGIKLWDLLVGMGVDEEKAEKGESADDDTPLVSFASWDNYQISSEFSFYQLANPDLFYFYEKSPLDIGTDRPTKAQLATIEYHPDNQVGIWEKDANNYPVKKGYPVLLAYGVNSYPYVRNAGMEGYKSGLGNSGGPLRLIYGKTDGLNRANANAEENYAYFYNNGSQQLQRLEEIYVGKGIRYSTHLENPLAAYQAMKNQQALTVEITAGGESQTRAFTLAELESILYDSAVSKRDRDNEGRQEKNYYAYRTYNDEILQDLFEGVNLEYLLTEVVGLQGSLGSVELYSGSNSTASAVYDLAKIGDKGFNSERGAAGLGMMVAFAKNGYPLVSGSGTTPGYVSVDPVTGKDIKNNGGPLQFVRGQTAVERDAHAVDEVSDTRSSVTNLTKIVVKLDPDPYAHIGAGYEDLAARQIKFSGAVAQSGGVSLTVGALETKQRYIVDGDYTVGGGSEFYRGLDLYSLLYDKDIGASTLMEEITIKNNDGDSTTLCYEELTAAGKKVILAYGKGIDDSAKPLNLAEGGPMRLIIEGGTTAECITNVSEIIVSAATINAWKHNFGVYSQYADQTLEISGQNLVHNKTYTIAELEAMDNIIVQDSYKISSNTVVVQGVELYKLLQNIGFADGAESSVFTVFASDGYSPGPFTASQLKDGINGKPVLVAFGQGTTLGNGLPLVADDKSPGYDNITDNQGGPLRLLIHDNSGWSVKFLTKIVVGQAGGNPDPDLKCNFHIYPGGMNNMPNASIRTVVSDDTGGIWAGSNGAGAAYITPAGTITKYTAPQLKTDFVTGIALGPDGSVWLAQGGSVGSQTAPPTNHYGFARYQNNNFTFYSSSNLPSECVYDLDVDKEGNVWLATQHTLLNGGMAGGLTKFAPATNQWQSWKMADGLPTVSAWAVKSDGMGGAWVTTYRTSNITLPWPDQSYAHISAEGVVTPYPIPAGNDYTWSRSISIDPEGGAYITRMSGAHDPANDGGWLDYISPGGSVKSYKGDDLIPDLKAKAKPGFYPEIRTVFVDDTGDLWLATNGLGVYRCNVSGDNISIAENFSSAAGSWPAGAFDDVWSIHVSPDGKAYFGSNGGVAWAEVTVVPKTYIITAKAGPGGIISPSGTVVVNKGANQIFTINPQDDYIIKDVLINGESIGPVQSCAFINVTANGAIEVLFEYAGGSKTHIITAIAGEGGTIDPGGEVEVEKGANQTFTIEAGDGYLIRDVLVDGKSIGAVSSCAFLDVAAEGHSIQAFFEYVGSDQKTYIITASANLGGTISPNGEVEVEKGTSKTFTITPNSDYLIADVLVDGESIGAVSSYTFSEVQANHIIETIFRLIDDEPDHIGDATAATALLTINGQVEKPGYFSMAGLKSYAAPYAQTDKFYSGRNNDSNDRSATFDGIYMEDLLKQIMVLNPNATKITVTPSDSYPPATFNLNSDEKGIYWQSSYANGDKILLAWKEDGNDLARPRLVVPQSNAGDINTPNWIRNVAYITVEETVVSDKYIIKATAGMNGTITPSGDVEVVKGSYKTFTITPNDDYAIKDVKVNDMSIGPVPSFTFLNVTTDDNTIEAFFEPEGGPILETYIITASAGAGGTISPKGEVEVVEDSNQIFDITPDNGYLISEILVDGKSVDIGRSYTFRDVRSAHTIAASFGPSGGGNSKDYIGDATAGTAKLTISGHVVKPGYFSIDGFKNESRQYAQINKFYPGLNTYGSDRSATFDGIYLEDLLNHVVALRPAAKSITITAADGYSASFNLDDKEKGIYWQSPVDNNKIMLAWKQDGGDLDRPRLIMPQINTNDANTPDWVSNVVSIVVKEDVASKIGGPGNFVLSGEEKTLSNKITETVEIKATSGDGKVTTTVKASDIASALSKIKNQLEPGGQAQLILNIIGTENLDVTDIIITAEALKALAEQNALSVSGKCALGEITLDGLLIAQANKAGKDLVITFENQDTSTLVTQAKKALSVKFTQGGQPLTQLDNLVKFSIPYKLSAADGSREQLVAGYLAESGIVIPISLCFYDEEGQCLNLAAPQPGLFLVQQKKFSFSDSVTWAEDAIDFLAARGIVQGRSNNLFLPNATVTRAEFLKMLLGTLPWTEVLTDAPEAGFKDVAKGAWYENYVNWAVAKGVISGYEDGTFRPNEPISREEIAVMVKNFLPAAGMLLPKIKTAPNFSDNDKINSWSLSAVQELYQYGLIIGFPDNSFRPQIACTRAQAAIIVADYIKAYLAE
ncbi:MAG: S-layer homology domain-containing protein [Clostridiales bacterium]|nr:S-layer homology domain-containing protein [Clostridiales bacterium]